MEKLTIEQKAIAYDKAIKVANKYKDTNIMFPSIQDEMFPELKESEDADEKVRKALTKLVTNHASMDLFIEYDIHLDEALSWLEKQGKKVTVIEGFETEFERQVSHLIASVINREHEYNEGFVKWSANALLNYAKHELEKRSEQKSTCSKEDEEMHRKCICAMRASACGFPEEEKFVEQVDNWLKFLKDRVQPQPQQEWNEEDEINSNICIRLMQTHSLCDKNIITWFNSLKYRIQPQNTWKPSDEQITWLYRAADDASKDSRMKQVLNNLLSDLKKLREK